MNRRGRVQVLTILMFLVGGAALYLIWVFWPYVKVYVEMREVAKSVVIEWAGMNEGKAKRRIQEEFRKQDIPEDQLTLDNCELKKEGNERMVHCDWELDVYYPPTQYYKTLSFDILAVHDGIEAIVESSIDY